MHPISVFNTGTGATFLIIAVTWLQVSSFPLEEKLAQDQALMRTNSSTPEISPKLELLHKSPSIDVSYSKGEAKLKYNFALNCDLFNNPEVKAHLDDAPNYTIRQILQSGHREFKDREFSRLALINIRRHCGL